MLVLKNFNPAFEFKKRVEKIKKRVELPKKFLEANEKEKHSLLTSIITDKITLKLHDKKIKY